MFIDRLFSPSLFKIELNDVVLVQRKSGLIRLTGFAGEFQIRRFPAGNDRKELLVAQSYFVDKPENHQRTARIGTFGDFVEKRHGPLASWTSTLRISLSLDLHAQ